MKYLLFFFSLFTFAQQTQFVDFKTANGQLVIDAKEKKIHGTVTYQLDVLKTRDTIKIDARKMQFSKVLLDNNAIDFKVTDNQLFLIHSFVAGKKTIELTYEATPKQALYFVGSEATHNLQIWTQGQGRYTSNWFPSFDDVNEKMIFNLDITFDSGYEVVANGLLKNKIQQGQKNIWQYRMQEPMSSYLLMLAIGKFDKKCSYSKSKIPLENYMEPADASKFETTYFGSNQIFDFLEKEIGVKYPWQIYRQIPVRDFLYAGMENTSSTLFSTNYVVDSIGFSDRKYTNVNAHELAHQWFGDLITAKEGKHHWLQEGFATYYALLAEKELYGEDYFYFKLYETAQQLKFASRTDTIPVLNAKASSLTFYEKGAWALFVLHQNIGDKAFKKAIKNYLNSYAFQTVTTDDFLTEINKVSKYDTESFKKNWLETVAFNTQEANDLLLKNKQIQLLFEVEKVKKEPLTQKAAFFKKVLQSDCYFKIKEYIVQQLKNENYPDKKELLQLALQTNIVSVRQEVAASLPKIPSDFKAQYETLLQDQSYQTQEIVLYYLWSNFPKDRFRYLELSKNWIGFNDYNLRTLWLSLALSTENYLQNPQEAVTELIAFSSPKYEAYTHQNALEKLLNFNILSEEVYINLVNATTHHMWQFSKYGRDTIRKMLKNPSDRAVFERILPILNPDEQFQLNRLLKE
ncbi:M1 family metallopeptidase [Flavobacterium agrisoli]|uniref:Aminopeptidase N n=1 Tax=Flavobacterium agrisoli TaxID=2793066 RepID=A0A934PK55_9FLAO|nr:M1 family metallopeptidase [Flavobacterium agrisoli]MBK0368844.1 M1 family metallopeptidase [Flavobacterium agrisoli]